MTFITSGPLKRFMMASKFRTHVDMAPPYKRKAAFMIYPLMFFFASSSWSCPFSVEIAKWRGDHRAAIAITADNPMTSRAMLDCQKLVTATKMVMDFEIVTNYFLKRKANRNFLKEVLIPSGFGYFGHGHTHVNHDLLTFEKSKESFQRCFDTMKSMGLNPVSYAYPFGAGLKKRTRYALAEAGFISARMAGYGKNGSPYIMPDEQRQPHDWLKLPSLFMIDSCADTTGRVHVIHNNEDLIPFLDGAISKTAWLILMYHAIGLPKAYSYYQFEEFQKDLNAIHSRDFWNASMNEITLYTVERIRAKCSVREMTRPGRAISKYELILTDGLMNDRFNVPLTLKVYVDKDSEGRTISVFQEGHLLSSQVVRDTRLALLSLLPNEIRYEVFVR